jgi:putative membrane protein
MKAIALALAAATILGAGCATRDEEPVETAAIDPNSPIAAPGYMRMAASGDMFEVQSSQLALQMSQNPMVRQFAQMMISDHTRTSGEMMGIAQGLGLPPPPQMMAPHHQQMLDQLRMAPPHEFDSAYKQAQIMAHQEALTLHRNYAQQGDVPQLRDFAARVVPAIEMHYNQAQGLPESAPPPMQQQPMPDRSGERG